MNKFSRDRFISVSVQQKPKNLGTNRLSSGLAKR